METINLDLIPVKQNWLMRVVQVNRFHVEQLKKDSTWRIQDTADALGRSLGSVSQDLLIASYLNKPNLENKIRSFRSMKDALAFVRSRKHESKIFEVEI